MNTRFICTQKTWFGGGIDLNPMFEDESDTKEFHQALKATCNKTDSNYYEKFKNGAMNISSLNIAAFRVVLAAFL